MQEKKKLTKKDKIAYALIVALGILVTVVATVLLAKTERAEAAEAFPSVDSLPSWPAIARCDEHLNGDDYLLIFKQGDPTVTGNGGGYYGYFFFYEKPTLTIVNGEIIVSASAGDCYLYNVGAGSWIGAWTNTNPISQCIASENLSRSIVGSNFAFESEFSEYPQLNIDSYSSKIEYTYSSTGPYLTYVSKVNYNSLYMEDKLDPAASYHKLVFNVDGVTEVPEDGYIAKVSLYYYLPSRDWMNGVYDLYLDANSDLSSIKVISSYLGNDEYVKWYHSTANTSEIYNCYCIEYELDFTGEEFIIQKTYEEILGKIEEQLGMTLLEYYGLSLDFPVESFCSTYLSFVRIDSILFFNDYQQYTYGNLQTWTFLPNLVEPVYYIYSGDPFFVGPPVDFVGPVINVNGAIDNEINKTYYELMQEALKENEALEDEINSYTSVDAAFADLDSSDVFGSFKSLSNGLMSIGNTLQSITYAAKSVLSFLPFEIQAVLYFGFISLIIISVVKAIRG